MLYRYIHIDAPWSLNYVVYRHFDDLKCDVHKLAETHRVATFVCKTEAEDYCADWNDFKAGWQAALLTTRDKQ